MNDPVRMTWPMYRASICSYHGRLVRLTEMEAELVAALLIRRGEVVSRNELLEAIYPDPELEPETACNCVAVLLGRARNKLPGLIQTEGHRGYCIDLPDEEIEVKVASPFSWAAIPVMVPQTPQPYLIP